MIRLFAVGMVITMATLFTASGSNPPAGVHRCAGAGKWFPASSSDLRRDVEKYLDGARVSLPPEAPVVAVVAPHAGYPYSGPIAGHSYAAVRGKAYDRVIILAFSHYVPTLEGLSVWDVASYETPLGAVPVDRDCVRRLLEDPLVRSVPKAHQVEHSDENQLPFLQVALTPGWKLVSVFVGQLEGAEQFERAAALLRPCISSGTLLVVSSDFTHLEEANPKEQNALDLGAAQLLVARDFNGFVDYIRNPKATICGRQPLALLLKILGPDVKGHLLAHRLSGEISGDWSYSVGYTSIAYTKGGPADPPAAKTAAQASQADGSQVAATLESDTFLSPEEEQTLLQLARRSLTEWVARHNDKINFAPFQLTDNLRRPAGAFVTLHERGELRGCIGYIQPLKPLFETVMENARNAATDDPRFDAVTAAELPAIDLEISVMSPLRKIGALDEIVVGRHGLLIQKGFYQGVFLPQVPVEQKWNRDQYLEGICRKAHLPRGAWREGADLFVFTAQVFGEKDSTEGLAAK